MLSNKTHRTLFRLKVSASQKHHAGVKKQGAVLAHCGAGFFRISKTMVYLGNRMGIACSWQLFRGFELIDTATPRLLPQFVAPVWWSVPNDFLYHELYPFYLDWQVYPTHTVCICIYIYIIIYPLRMFNFSKWIISRKIGHSIINIPTTYVISIICIYIYTHYIDYF